MRTIPGKFHAWKIVVFFIVAITLLFLRIAKVENQLSQEDIFQKDTGELLPLDKTTVRDISVDVNNNKNVVDLDSNRSREEEVKTIIGTDPRFIKTNNTFTGAIQTRLISEVSKNSSFGRLVNIHGWPVCEWTNVCLRSYGKSGMLLSYYMFEDSGAFTLLNSTSAERSTQTTVKSRLCQPYYGHDRVSARVHLTNTTQLLKEINYSFPDVVYLPGTTFILDTVLYEPQYGHVGSKVVQFFHLQNLTQVERVFMVKQSRYPSKRRPEKLPLTQLVKLSLGRFYEKDKSLYRSDAFQYGLVCMEKTLEIRSIVERTFIDESQINAWVTHANDYLQGNSTCLDVDAPVVLLQRKDGMGLRRLLNFMDVGVKVLMELGIICNASEVNIAVANAGMPLQDQARLFRTAGLLFSSHSSQLRNSLFSHRVGGVMEIRPAALDSSTNDRGYKRFPSPFCVDYMCPPVYSVSSQHQSQRGKEYRIDFNINETIFRQDVLELVKRQKQRIEAMGCPMLNFHNPGRCQSKST